MRLPGMLQDNKSLTPHLPPIFNQVLAELDHFLTILFTKLTRTEQEQNTRLTCGAYHINLAYSPFPGAVFCTVSVVVLWLLQNCRDESGMLYLSHTNKIYRFEAKKGEISFKSERTFSS